MLLPNRNASTDTYRYGFNGKEKDDEVKGEGLHYDYGFRVYDPRLGKFLSQDPLFKGFPHYSPYQFAGNSPVMNVDLDGLEELPVTKSRIVHTNIVYVNGEQLPDGETVKVLLYHDFSIDKIRTVKTGRQIISPGYEGSEYRHVTNTYKTIQRRPSLKGVRQFSVLRHPDTINPATGPPPKPVKETKPKLGPTNDEKTGKVSTGIKNTPQETVNETTINQNQRIEKTETFELDIPFKARKPKYANYNEARRILDPILDKLKMHPDNMLEITINTQFPSPTSVVERNFFSKNYLASDLSRDRVEYLKNELRNYNVDLSKVKINSTIDSSKNYKLDAKLTTQENP